MLGGVVSKGMKYPCLITLKTHSGAPISIQNWICARKRPLTIGVALPCSYSCKFCPKSSRKSLFHLSAIRPSISSSIVLLAKLLKNSLETSANCVVISWAGDDIGRRGTRGCVIGISDGIESREANWTFTNAWNFRRNDRIPSVGHAAWTATTGWKVWRGFAVPRSDPRMKNTGNLCSETGPRYVCICYGRAREAPPSLPRGFSYRLRSLIKATGLLS